MKFTEVAQPLPMAVPIANDGDKNFIPLNSTKTNLASLKDGFPDITQKSADEGGLPPVRADFNGMFYLSTDQRIYLQNGGIITFSQSVSDEIGGYPKGAILEFVDEKIHSYTKVRSLIDDNTYNFVEDVSFIDGIHWENLKFGSSGCGLDLATVVCMPFGIDESENKYRYLNGQVIIQEQFPEFTKKVKSWQSTRANLFTTETNWQAEKTASVLGQCGKFVVDDTAGTIRLPLIININGLTDLANCGVLKDESLPNVTGHIQNVGVQYDNLSYSGAFKNSVDLGRPNNWAMYDPNVNWAKLVNVQFSASSSSATYQDNAPVQQESIQYPYVIVVNTGVEEAERPINNYQVNNVYSYGMSTYYKGTMSNSSWLRSSGQWNSGTVYNGAYEWAVGKLNEKVYDPSKFTVVGSPTITDDGIASGFSKSDYITFTKNITPSNYIEFYFNGSTSTLTGATIGENPLLTLLDSNNTEVALFELRPSGLNSEVPNFYMSLKNVDGNSIYSNYNASSLSWQPNVMYYFKLKFDGVKYTIARKTENTDYEIFYTITTTSNLGTIAKGYIGRRYANTTYCKGQIDLKQFSINVDGEEVFSGSKIVQADGFKKSTDSDITDYDWVVNTEEQTFRLPLKNGQEGVFADKVKGNGLNLGFTNGNTNTGLWNGTNGDLYANTGSYGANNGSTTRGNVISSETGIGVTTDSSKSGIVVDLTVPSGYNLYYYIGDTLQNADLVNLARLGEELVDIKSTPHIVETYVNGTSGYRIWSKDSTGYRYCEQWGFNNIGTTDDITLSLLKPFRDTTYNLQLSSTQGTGVISSKTTKQTSTITVKSSSSNFFDWQASGYIAD